MSNQQETDNKGSSETTRETPYRVLYAEDIVQSLGKDKGVITTIINMRAPGMTMHKIPLFV